MSDFTPLYGQGGFSRDTRFLSMAERSFQSSGSHKSEAAPEDPLALAWAEGHAAGVAETRSSADANAQAEAQARNALSLSFARLDADLAERLRQKLHETVVALCEETLRPLAVDRPALARRVETAVAMFARADDERVIRLNPADLELMADYLPKDWNFQADPALVPGALRVETASGGVEDGPEQWREAIIEALRLC